jgi:hypothetical protein
MIKSRRIRWAWHAAHMRVRRNAFKILVGTPEGTRPLGISRCRCENKVKMDLRELGWGLIWL